LAGWLRSAGGGARLKGLDVGAKDTAGGSWVQADFSGELAGDPRQLPEVDGAQVVPLPGEGDQPVLLAGVGPAAVPSP
jgi:hypothetical protein